MPVPEQKKQVVIVGAGFAGLAAAKKLAGCSQLEVTILDRRNHHLFQPLLYQVATASLSPADIAAPIRSILSHKKNCRIILDYVERVDLEQRKIFATTREFAYDVLILACGATHSYFGHNEWEVYAPGLKSLEEATEIRRRILTAFEYAERTTDPEEEKRYLTFVVVGGGPTGVELAGALAEISRHTLSRDFNHIDPKQARVLLLEAGPRILSNFAESLSQQATRDLERLGVTVWTSSYVTRIKEDGVWLGNKFIPAATVLWAAGVQASELNQTLQVPLDRQGRVIVEADCSIQGHPEVFVIGDQCHFAHPQMKPKNDATGLKPASPLPGLAPVAMQQGRSVATNIKRDLQGKMRVPFHYVDKGQMATIGRKYAVVEVKSLKFDGFFAWLTWLFVHIYYLIGFKNRLFVLLQWAWSYFTFRRGARLIVQKQWQQSMVEKLLKDASRPVYQDVLVSNPEGGENKIFTTKISKVDTEHQSL